ncbi:glycoside hydrolase family 76 protein [Dactylosporangium sp. NBC_01737]|uniref:glycoside hydrolase family 76 protein n=1 Tax=Dactylosporangium sp. NBC_01737 TaxID=2975959 RepID=UPI002E0FB2B6|nr:glycoside hydrolase family 76 protein [Dactylosporangium sp. NBC_01737]
MRRALITLLLLGSVLLPAPAAHAATAICALYCDTRDPSLARQETFPVPAVTVNGRRLVLHVSDVDGMAWGSIDAGVLGDAVWLDRSFDGGTSWEGLLGKASIPGTWTGTRTLMYNVGDPSHHRRGVIRACGDARGIACTAWSHLPLCAPTCDGAAGGTDAETVRTVGLNGRTFGLHLDAAGMAWGTVSGGRAGDEIWLDRSWDAGASWPGGSSLGRTTATRTTRFNTADPTSLLYGGAVRACGRAVEGQNGACTAWARPSSNRARAMADALMYSYDPSTAWWPSSWWNSAVALRTVIDYTGRTGDTTYLWSVRRTFDVNRVAFPAGARSSDPIDGHFISRSIDDSAWWGLTWLAAYDLTGDRAYLDEAVTIAAYVNGFWDTSTCGGGVWWDRERTYKNAVTIGLYVRLTAALHNRLPGDTTWLQRAVTGWNWFTASGLVNAAGLVNDGLTAGCANNGQTVWSYNQGLAIGAATELYRATGTTAYLDRARQLGTAALASSLVRSGVLAESCDATGQTCDDNAKQFKGIFMGYLAEAGAQFQSFRTTQATTVWNGRDGLNRVGSRWAAPSTGDWRTQASALSAILTG